MAEHWYVHDLSPGAKLTAQQRRRIKYFSMQKRTQEASQPKQGSNFWIMLTRMNNGYLTYGARLVRPYSLIQGQADPPPEATRRILLDAENNDEETCWHITVCAYV